LFTLGPPSAADGHVEGCSGKEAIPIMHKDEEIGAGNNSGWQIGFNGCFVEAGYG
jgi:hypothetical protein